MPAKFDVIHGSNEPPATHSQIAAMEFKSVRQFRGWSKTQRNKKTDDFIKEVRLAFIVATEIVSLEKSELIELVDKKYDTLGPMLMELDQAGKTAAQIVEIIRAAEVRLAVALANVEEEEEENFHV